MLNVIEASYSSLCSFISEHNQYLSYGNLVEYFNSALFITVANKEDILTYRKAKCGPKKAGFITTMGKEMLHLMELDVSNLVNRTPDMKVISGVWALQQK